MFLFIYLFIGLDQIQNSCLKIERPHNICWPALKHIVEQESRQRNGEGLVFLSSKCSPQEAERWGVLFSILPSLNLQDMWLNPSSNKACKIHQHRSKKDEVQKYSYKEIKRAIYDCVVQIPKS